MTERALNATDTQEGPFSIEYLLNGNLCQLNSVFTVRIRNYTCKTTLKYKIC